MPKKIPDFDTMWGAFPCGDDIEKIKKTIGGNVNAAYIKNTCTIRLSASLNRAGNLVPVTMHLGMYKKKPDMLETVSGGDGKRYALKVRQFEKYMRIVYGEPTITWENPNPEKPIPDFHRTVAPRDIPFKIKGKRGIIGFKVDGWGDATGHFDLWYESYPAHKEYFYNAQKVYLWAETKRGVYSVS